MINVKLIKEHTKDLSVLYVEDDLSLIESTSELLKNFFKRLDTAHDGETGLAKYLDYEKEFAKHYDLIITDINMPKMSGIAMGKKMLEINSEQVIVITTAHHEIEHLSSALDLGIDGFITKPLQNEKLMNVLYKVAHAISNSKFVESHIEMIEDLNMRLDTQNRELVKKNKELEKSFRMLDTMVHKDHLTHPKKTSQAIKEEIQKDERLQEQIQSLIEDDLEELKEIHIEIDLIVIDILNNSNSIDMGSLQELTDKFMKYASVLSFYNFFDKLGSSMKNFAITIKEKPLPENEESRRNIFMLLESFIYVLGKWQNDLFHGDSKTINSLDASMISDMKTIVNMWTQADEEFSERDLERIFNFCKN